MDNTIQYYAVWLKAILKRADGKVLILKVPEWYKQAWFYDFPGWRIDKTEFNVELSDILKREISEEVWDIKYTINMSPISSWRTYCEPNEKYNYEEYIFYNYYECEYISWDILVSEEHSEFEWVDLSELDIRKHFYNEI